MKRLLTALVITVLLYTGAFAEMRTVYYLSGDGKTVSGAMTEVETPDVFLLLEALGTAPFGTDVQAVLTDGTKVTSALCVNGYALIGIETNAAVSGLVYECIGRTVIENTNADYVTFMENGRFASEYPSEGCCVLFLPERTGRYIVPVVCRTDEVTVRTMLRLLSEEREDMLSGIPGNTADAEYTYSFTGEGCRALEIDFPMSVFSALENSEETRWQFLASVSMTLLTNIADIDCIRISFEGQDVTGVPDRDGTLLRLENEAVDITTFAGYVGSRAADGKYVSAADSRNPGALLACVLPEIIKPGDVISYHIEQGAAEVSLSSVFYALCGNMDAAAEAETVYAIVDTLCENTYAEKVRIVIEGQPVSTLAGSISLEGYLMPKRQFQR